MDNLSIAESQTTSNLMIFSGGFRVIPKDGHQQVQPMIGYGI